jgi:hypothetical protein
MFIKLHRKCLCKFLEVHMARDRISQVETQYVITDSNSISHYTFTHLSSNQSCTFIFIFLLKTHSVTLNCPTSMKTILHNIKRWNHIVSSKLTILAVINGSWSYIPSRNTVCNFSSLPNMRKHNAYRWLLYPRYEYYIMDV